MKWTFGSVLLTLHVLLHLPTLFLSVVSLWYKTRHGQNSDFFFVFFFLCVFFCPLSRFPYNRVSRDTKQSVTCSRLHLVYLCRYIIIYVTIVACLVRTPTKYRARYRVYIINSRETQHSEHNSVML